MSHVFPLVKSGVATQPASANPSVMPASLQVRNHAASSWGVLQEQLTLNHRVPGSSPGALRKPHLSDTTPNRAFLRGFPATHIPDFGLCGRLRISVAIFGALSPHPKIPFPAASFEREVRLHKPP